MKVFRRCAIAILCFGMLAGCPDPKQSLPQASTTTPDRESAEYLQKLVTAIDTANEIIVTEHSNEFDAYDMKAGESLIPVDVVYQRVTLTAEQRRDFSQRINALPAVKQEAFSACIFEPHHTITFLQKGTKTRELRVCFECAQVDWDATTLTPPWSIYPGLAKFVDSIGLHSDRDWQAVAREHLKKPTAGK